MSDLADALSSFAVDKQPKTKRTTKAGPLQKIEPKRSGIVLAFDQSLSATGVTMLLLNSDPHASLPVGVLLTATIRTEQMADKAHSHEDMLLRGEVLGMEAERVMREIAPHLSIDLALHETPPIPSGQRGVKAKTRPDSNLVCCANIRAAARNVGIPVKMVGSQKAKSLLTGDRYAEKSEVRAALFRLLPLLATCKPFNDNISDATAIAVVAAQEGW